MFRRLLQRVAGAAILLLTTIGAQADTIRLVASSANVSVGSSFDIDVIAEDINLGGFDLTLGFSPARAGFSAVVPDLFLGDPGLFESFFSSSPGLDTVQISAVSLLDSAALIGLQHTAPGNSFRLATLTFDANAAGLAEFSFAETFLTGPDANQINADFFGTSVTISAIGEPPSAVPEPATWMVVAGLFLILVGRTRQKRGRLVVVPSDKQRSSPGCQ